jgi:uncharacterized protein
MHIALIGATGFIGSAILKEILSRGHLVTALVAHPEKLAPANGMTPVGADVLDQGKLAVQLKGHDAVISAFSGHAQGDIYGYYVQGIRSIIGATKDADVQRLLVVGGAGSLEVAPGLQLLDTPDFPEIYRASAEGARAALKLLGEEQFLNWTMLSPSAMIAPGERTGRFRFGSDQLLVNEKGESRISVSDYAVAMVDELEKPVHARQRFTVGY